jgi:urease accessory protein
MTSAHSSEDPRADSIHFQPMHLIQRMLAETSALPPERQIVLAVERRLFLKRRWRFHAEDGTEFGFDLETRLIDGCVIFHKDGSDYLVRQLPETVYQIPFESATHAALVAWKTGNLHLPAQLLDDAILVLHDEAMTQLLERESWRFSEPEVVFTPMKTIAHST